MVRSWLAVLVLGLAGCSEKLPGSTWEGTYDRWTVTYEFVGNDVARRTLTSTGGYNKETSNLTYAVNGNQVKFTNMGMVAGIATLDHGQLVTTPHDCALTQDTESKITLVKK